MNVFHRKNLKIKIFLINGIRGNNLIEIHVGFRLPFELLTDLYASSVMYWRDFQINSFFFRVPLEAFEGFPSGLFHIFYIRNWRNMWKETFRSWNGKWFLCLKVIFCTLGRVDKRFLQIFNFYVFALIFESILVLFNNYIYLIRFSCLKVQWRTKNSSFLALKLSPLPQLLRNPIFQVKKDIIDQFFFCLRLSSS